MTQKKDATLYTMFGTLRLVEKYIAAEMAKYGMKSSYRTILPTLAAKDGVTQLDLVRATGLKAPTISTTLRNMEDAGFVRREKYENDLRATLVYLTPQGAELDKKMKAAVKKAERILMDGVTAEEKAQLAPILSHINKNISDAVGGEI